MNKQITNNRYILKGSRAWHDFMHSNISMPVFLSFYVFMFLVVAFVITTLGVGKVW